MQVGEWMDRNGIGVAALVAALLFAGGVGYATAQDDTPNPEETEATAEAIAAFDRVIAAARAREARECVETNSEVACFRLWTSCAPIAVRVSVSTPNDARLTHESLRNLVEVRLRAARLYSLERFTELQVHVTVVGAAFGISLDLYKLVSDMNFGLQTGPAITWNAVWVGTHSNNAGFILSGVSQALDAFLVDYLRVNENACGSP